MLWIKRPRPRAHQCETGLATRLGSGLVGLSQDQKAGLYALSKDACPYHPSHPLAGRSEPELDQLSGRNLQTVVFCSESAVAAIQQPGANFFGHIAELEKHFAIGCVAGLAPSLDTLADFRARRSSRLLHAGIMSGALVGVYRHCIRGTTSEESGRFP